MDDNKVRGLYTRNEIAKRVESLAGQIAVEYSGKNLLLIGILKGSVVLLSDLIRALYDHNLTEVEIDFMTVSSYGTSTKYSGMTIIVHDLTKEIAGRDVLIVEDIIDTGHTLKFIQSYLKEKNPNTLKTLAFLDKKEKREVEVPVDYTGFTLSGTPWVEGYGLDGGEYGRGRPDIVEKKIT